MLSKFKYLILFLFTFSIVLNLSILSFMNSSITNLSQVNLTIYKDETSLPVRECTQTGLPSPKNVNSPKPNSEKIKEQKSPHFISSHIPLKGQITSRFGRRWGRMHKGIDIMAEYGASIRAFQDGRVSFSGHKRGYGKLVIIEHEGNLSSYYAHNSENLVKKDDKVQRGDKIAKVGSSGNATAPHLHFEIRKNGVPVNPLIYLKDFQSVNN